MNHSRYLATKAVALLMVGIFAVYHDASAAGALAFAMSGILALAAAHVAED